jgi:hypothetical protein
LSAFPVGDKFTEVMVSVCNPGGKDSLVVWHQYVQQCKALGSDNDSARPSSDEGSPRPLLVYAADGMEEFSGSWRLQKLVAMTGDSVRLG